MVLELVNAKTLLADQRFLFRDLPVNTVQIGGSHYPCLVVSAEDGNDWREGGLLSVPEQSILVERKLFGDNLPTQGTPAVFRGKLLRVAMVRHDHDQSPVRIALESRVEGKS